MKRRIRIFPRVRFTVYKGAAKSVFKRWFSVSRLWGGELIFVSIRHFEMALDYRRDPAKDIAEGIPKKYGKR